MRGIFQETVHYLHLQKGIVMNKITVGFYTSLLLIGLLSTGTSYAQMSGSMTKPAMVSASDMIALKDVNSLLIENREIARKIAGKLGIVASTTTPGTGELPEKNNALIIRNQHLFKQIAVKLGATVPAFDPPITGTLIEQNHEMLLQNRLVVKAIAEKLDVPLTGTPSTTGTLVEQNRELLKLNRTALTKFSVALGVK